MQLEKDKAAYDGMTPILVAASSGHEQPLGRRMLELLCRFFGADVPSRAVNS